MRDSQQQVNDAKKSESKSKPSSQDQIINKKITKTPQSSAKKKFGSEVIQDTEVTPTKRMTRSMAKSLVITPQAHTDGTSSKKKNASQKKKSTPNQKKSAQKTPKQSTSKSSKKTPQNSFPGSTIPEEAPQESHIIEETMNNGTKMIEEFPKSPEKKTVNIKFHVKDFVGENSDSLEINYTLLRPALGRGTYGEVFKATHKKSKQEKAVKVIKKSRLSLSDFQKFQREKDVLRNLDHPNIIKTYEFYEDPQNFYVITEICHGGDLFNKIVTMVTFTEKQAAEIMNQVLSAVNYCHKKKIVHRDLKPENILFDSKDPDAIVKVIDFGFADYFFDNTKFTISLGTSYYVAPEVLRGSYDAKCDVWSLGVILYILLCGYPPFDGPTDQDIFAKIKEGKYSMVGAAWDNISAAAKDLISKMICSNPVERISAEDALSHSWFKTASFINSDKCLATDTMKNLQSFASTFKLQETIWSYLVNLIGTKDEQNKLMNTFKSLDLDGDGTLTIQELMQYYTAHLGDEAKAKIEVDNIMKKVDTDGSGKIDYSEFVSASLDRDNALTSEKMREAFNIFDSDGNGVITMDELKHIFNKGVFKDISDEMWSDMISEVDKNNDGEIDFDEFKEMMSMLSANNRIEALCSQSQQKDIIIKKKNFNKVPFGQKEAITTEFYKELFLSLN